MCVRTYVAVITLELSLGSLVLGSLGGIVSGLSTLRHPNTSVLVSMIEQSGAVMPVA
ncbi:MAG TPA: hypothetical protein VHT52_07080 [Stellaceae bacterium]|jgi:hypothetical protein|nr:hypothetical protein [Stellaceae bacterium]